MAPSDSSRKRETQVSKMIKLRRADPLEECDLFKMWGELRRQLGLPTDFDNRHPLARNRLLLRTGGRGPLIEDFPRLGGRLNILRSVASSHRFLSSGLNSCAAFGATLGRPFISPTRDTVLIWGATFAPWRNFRSYLGHLKKGCMLDRGGLRLVYIARQD